MSLTPAYSMWEAVKQLGSVFDGECLLSAIWGLKAAGLLPAKG